jgi:spore germination protein YaaH
MTNQPSEKRSTNPHPAVYPEYPAQPQQPENGGCGCWITGLITLVIALCLIAVGLFLPPVNLYERLTSPAYTTLAQAGNTITQDGLSLSIAEGSSADFGASIQTQTGNVSIPVSDHALSGYVYTIRTTGTAPDGTTLTLPLSPNLNGAEVDVYGWDQDGGNVRFIPSSVTNGQISASVSDIPENIAVLYAQPPAQPQVVVAVDVTQTLSADAGEAATIVAPAGLQPTLAGSLTGSLAAGFDTNATYRVVPVIRNFSDPRATDPQTISAILSNRDLRETHASQLAAFAASGYDGVMLDYRDLPLDQRDNFTALVNAVARNLANTGLTLGVVVPQPTLAGGDWDSGAYDWAALGQAADVVQMRLENDPALFGMTPDAPINGLLSWAVSQVERGKLVLGLSSLSQREVDGVFAPIGIEQALSALGDVTITSDAMTAGGVIPPGESFEASLDGYNAVQGTDETTGLRFIEYTDENNAPVSRVWLTTAGALANRLNAAPSFGLGGIAFDDLNAEGIAAGVLPTIMTYKLGLPLDTPADELALHWTIQGAEGTAVGEVTTELGESLMATITAPPGNYAVNVAIVQGDNPQAQREGAAVAVFAPTLTASPTNTPLPTDTPMPTNTPLPIVLPTAEAAAPQVVAAAPAAGSIVGGSFEYGGHVTSAQTGARDAMRRAGMNWMKVQLRYFPGMSASDAGQIINDAHGHGFKILLGVVGSPGDLANGGTGYMQDFAGFLASVAGYGPDAIEVWNEPNLDREWPEGQISGATYAEMLRLAYNAIKGSNPGVMVISGAPAPTGAEGAYPGRVMNDDRWVSEVVAAGGLQYMDCLGAHYNEGIVGPSAYSGDPRDNYYTRYFGGMLDTYWSLTGGQRPICFTELGYLTPEGFPPLPSYFSWAQNVSLSQQAAWLAEAAALSSQSGRVRLMIVWNVDFTVYDSDPQAGYAIVRPGGDCPACDALAAAR